MTNDDARIDPADSPQVNSDKPHGGTNEPLVVSDDESLVVFDHVTQEFPRRGGPALRALNAVSFSIGRGETYGLVGESGSGKSTLARAAMMLRQPTSGSITLDGLSLTGTDRRTAKKIRRKMQMVFQDPNASLDPRFTITQSVMEPLLANRVPIREARRRAGEVLEEVGLPSDSFGRRPHEFSGGQKQRVAVARALAPDPEFVILDEPTSALDVSVQAQILNLLLRLQRDRGLTYLFISHDLGVIRHLSHRVGVLYLGDLVEEAPTAELFDHPQHNYTRTLLAAVPSANPAA